MPLESANLSKYSTALPGAYSDPSRAAFVPPATGRGSVALLSPTSFTRLEPNTPTLVTSAQALRELIPVFGARFARAIFAPAPATEPDVGAPARVYLVNAAPSVRAQRTFYDGGGIAALTLKSRIWGLDGNKIWFKQEAGTTKGKKLTIGYEALSFPLDNVGGDTIFSLEYDQAEATTMTATIIPATRVVVNYTKDGALAAPATDSYVPHKMAFAGPIRIDIDQDPVSVTLVISITGTIADGSTVTRTLSFAPGGALSQVTADTFIAVTSIARTNGTGWGSTTTASVSGKAFDLPIATYDKVADVLSAINAASAAGFTATDVAGDSATRNVSSLDGATATDITSAANFTATLDAIIKAIGNDEADEPIEPLGLGALVIAERPAVAVGPPDNFSAQRYLLGGADGTATTGVGGSWELACEALRELEVDQIWAESTDSAVQSILIAHCDYMHGAGRYECGLDLATTARPTKATAKALPPTANRDYVSVWCQRTAFRDENNTKRMFDPLYTALRAACAAAGLSHPAMPLTYKQFDILDIEDGSDWTFRKDAEELVQARLCLIERKKRDGLTFFRVAREVSAWLQNDDPLATERSTVRSQYRATRAMRLESERIVGKPNFDGTASSYLAGMESRLRRLRDTDRLIKDYDPSRLGLEDGGAVFVFTPESIQPVEGVNFAIVKPVYARIPVTL